MKNYRKPKFEKSSLEIYAEIEGEHLETKVERMFENGEPIEESAPLTYTRRDEGVRPGEDIRTNRLELAMELMDNASKSITAKRAEMQLVWNKEKEEKKGDESTVASGNE